MQYADKNEKMGNTSQRSSNLPVRYGIARGGWASFLRAARTVPGRPVEA
ncbi:hypothetical protein [Nonomuraea sp. bgisy101]